MSLKEVQKDFSGLLRLDKPDTACQFAVVGHKVTILPTNTEAAERIKELSYNGVDNNRNTHFWFYGCSDAETRIAILLNSRVKQGFGTQLKAGYFMTPMIAQASETSIVDVSRIKVIDFYGGVADALLNPALAFGTPDDNGAIIYRDSNEYTKEFDAKLGNDRFKVIYTIDTPTKGELSLNVNDIKGTTHGVLRFVFEEVQPLDRIEEFYGYAMRIFQFCSGRLNVYTKIRYYGDKNNRAVLVKYVDGYSDYAENLDPMRVVSFKMLGSRFIELFHLLNQKHFEPYMEFLPIANKYVGIVSYTQVNDICVSFQKEYSRWTKIREDEEKKKQQQQSIELDKENNPAQRIADAENDKSKESRIDLKKAAEVLTDKLLTIVDEDEGIPEEVKKKAKNILNSQLKTYAPSLKEQIIHFYGVYKEPLKMLTEIDGHNILGISRFYTDEEFKKLIGKFVDIRNLASHAGIEWNGSEEIYTHLVILVYLSVLNRAGYTPNEAGCIITWMFQSMF